MVTNMNPKTAQEIISEAADYLGISADEFVTSYLVGEGAYNEALTKEEAETVDKYLRGYNSMPASEQDVLGDLYK